MLNFHGNLGEFVKIDTQRILILGKRKPVPDTLIKIDHKDWQLFASQCRKFPEDSLIKFLKSGNFPQINSINRGQKALSKINSEKPLYGKRIVLDPGHIAGNLSMAKTEGKYLLFTKSHNKSMRSDSAWIAEGILTYQTAAILKKMLEEKGAEVLLTREAGESAFGIQYSRWLQEKKQIVLDSLLSCGVLTKARYQKLNTSDNDIFFRSFFKELDLKKRIEKINNWSPDLTLIIHFNVDEKNAPWLGPTTKNFVMAFIPGCLTPENIETKSGSIRFLELLLSDDIEKSGEIAGYLVDELSKNLQIPKANQNDADYLIENCMATSRAGVFARNLALCRQVKGVLAYGECLYQDNDKEFEKLSSTASENVKAAGENKRLRWVATSYLSSVLTFYDKNK